jgi:hypothetical protein
MLENVFRESGVANREPDGYISFNKNMVVDAHLSTGPFALSLATLIFSGLQKPMISDLIRSRVLQK